MNEAEARALLDAEVERLRELEYHELQRLFDAAAEQVTGPSGTVYTLEIQAFWDDQAARPAGTARRAEQRAVTSA